MASRSDVTKAPCVKPMPRKRHFVFGPELQLAKPARQKSPVGATSSLTMGEKQALKICHLRRIQTQLHRLGCILTCLFYAVTLTVQLSTVVVQLRIIREFLNGFGK